MIFLLAFWGFFFGALAVSWRAGDRRDRRIVLTIMLAAAGTSLAHVWLTDRPAIAAAVAIDVALLAIVSRYALSTRRYWPLWFAGFHAASVLFNAGSLALTDDHQMIAQRIGAFWSLPALLAMSIGLVTDRHRGVTQRTPPG